MRTECAPCPECTAADALLCAAASPRDFALDEDPDSQLLPLKSTTNVLVLARLQQLESMSTVNFFLALLCVVYIAVNITCIILNGYDNDLWPDAGVVSKALFHNLEFWATFVFSCAEVVALAYSPKPEASRPDL
jgi:hypothetical protein